MHSSARVIDMFRAFDKDGDGKVTKAEFRATLPLLGFDSSNTAVVDGIFDKIDADKSGSVEYSELGTSLRRDDIVLSAELQAGAVKFDVEAKNKIALREKES